MLHTLVFPQNIQPVWTEAKEILSKSIELGGTHNTEDVRALLLCGSAQLWIQFGEKVEVAIVTEFARYPRKTRLRIWLAGAIKNASANWDKFQEIICDFAKVNGVEEIECLGRFGWGKKFPASEKTRQEFVYKIGKEIEA